MEALIAGKTPFEVLEILSKQQFVVIDPGDIIACYAEIMHIELSQEANNCIAKAIVRKQGAFTDADIAILMKGISFKGRREKLTGGEYAFKTGYFKNKRGASR